MKKVSLFLVAGCLGICSYCQGFSVDEFIELATYSPKKLEAAIAKKGFIPSNRTLEEGNLVDSWIQASRSADSSLFPIVRQLSKYQQGDEISFCLQTTSKEEQDAAIARLKNEGFSYGLCKKDKDSAVLFQRKTTTVRAYTYEAEDVVYYCLLFQNQPVPSPRSIRYAGDLLKFSSHELLVASFGEKYVKKDRYHFSGNEINNCSVLFPNTPRQAVFIWEDQQNFTTLDQVIISGNLPTETAIGFDQRIGENAWVLEEGIRFNMRLDELIRTNGDDIQFYGKNANYSLMVVPQKKGEIDFSTTVVMLDCINCEGSPLLDKKIISATEALDNSLRLYVGMIILLPHNNSSDSKKYASR